MDPSLQFTPFSLRPANPPTLCIFRPSDSVTSAADSQHGGQDLDIDLVRVMMKSNIQDYLRRIPFLKKCPPSRIETLVRLEFLVYTYFTPTS